MNSMLPVATELPVCATVAVKVTGWSAVAGLGVALAVICEPEDALPPDSPFRAGDPKREFFASPRLASAEVVLPDLRNALLVGTRTA